MIDYKSLEQVLTRCKFVQSIPEVRALLPKIENEIPLVFKIASTSKEIVSEGYPVVPNRVLEGGLRSLVETEIARHLANPHYSEDLLSRQAEERLLAERYVQVLSELLIKTTSAGTIFKFENILWLLLSETIAESLNHHPQLNQLLLRDPARYGRIKVAVLTSAVVRNRLANATMQQIFKPVGTDYWTQRVYKNPLNEIMAANRLIFTERPDSLYSTTNFRNIFLVKSYAQDFETFDLLNRFIRDLLLKEAENLSRGRLSARNLFLQETFFKDQTAKRGGNVREDPTRALALSLDEKLVNYLLFHLDSSEQPKEIKKSFRDVASVQDLSRGYLEVARDFLAWDFLNTLRSLIREIQMEHGKAYLADVELSDKTIPITLDGDTIYNHKRWGTYALFDIIGFSRRAREVITEHAGLAIQNLFSIRREKLALFDGRPEYFEGDAVFEIFERAIDSLRYTSAFLDHYESQRVIKRGLYEAPIQSPFVDGIRVGIGTGETFLISVYQGEDHNGDPREEFRRIGLMINLASRLTTGKMGDKFLMGPNPGQEADPLGIFKVSVGMDGELNNNGIASLESTFLELREQVRLEGLKCYDRDVAKQKGRPAPFRHYDFDLIYQDPIIDRILLVRSVKNRPVFKGFEEQKVKTYEYLILKVNEFRDLRLRDMELDLVHKAVPTTTIADEFT